MKNNKMKIKYLFITGIILILLSNCKKEPTLLSDTGTLPIIKITIDEKYLWSADSGLYLLDDCFEKWEFPATIEYLEENSTIFYDSIGFRIKGEASRGQSMKSFGIYWKEEYGKKNLEYQMFPDISISKFKRLFLRNSGNDFGETHIKDASISMIYKDYANVEYQAYKPCVLYLNNDYWGIYNIREMITPHHFDYHFNVNNDEVDEKWKTWIRTDWKEWEDTNNDSDFSDDEDISDSAPPIEIESAVEGEGELSDLLASEDVLETVKTELSSQDQNTTVLTTEEENLLEDALVNLL